MRRRRGCSFSKEVNILSKCFSRIRRAMTRRALARFSPTFDCLQPPHSIIASVFAINLNKSVYYHKTISMFMCFGVVSELLLGWIDCVYDKECDKCKINHLALFFLGERHLLLIYFFFSKPRRPSNLPFLPLSSTSS